MGTALEAAQLMAANAHQGQMYGENQPYTVHLERVVETLQRYGVTDENMLVAGWLHDIVEDTDVTLNQVELMFGRTVSDLVGRVTNEEGKNRKERHAKTYPKIKASDDALVLKLADRIANVEYSVEQGDKDKLKMYSKEYEGFREALNDGKNIKMWNQLDFLLNYKNQWVEDDGKTRNS